MKKKTRNLNQTRQKILTAAFAEVFVHGFQATSIDNILKKTSLTKGALFHQFPTKIELGYALVTEVLVDMIKERWVDPLVNFENPIEGILFQLKKNIGDAPAEILYLGCPLNNLTQEMSNVDMKFQAHLHQALNLWIDGIEVHIQRAQKDRWISKKISAHEIAEFIVMSHEGFYGMIKSTRDKSLFKSLLKSLEIYFISLADYK